MAREVLRSTEILLIRHVLRKQYGGSTNVGL